MKSTMLQAFTGGTIEQKAAAEVEKRRADPKTYSEPLDYSRDPKMKEFLMDFYKNVLFKKQDEMKELLKQHPKTIGKFYKKLVPSQMENEDFWQRYYYRVKSVDELLAEWGEGGGIKEEEPPSPKRAERNVSTMALLQEAEMSLSTRPTKMTLDDSDIEEESDPEGFQDASETEGEAKKGRSPGSKSYKSDGDDSDSSGGGRSVKSAYSYRSHKSSSDRSTRSAKTLSAAQESRRQKRSKKRSEGSSRSQSPKKSSSNPNRRGSFKAREMALLKSKSDKSLQTSFSSFRARRMANSSLGESFSALQSIQRQASKSWGDKKEPTTSQVELEASSDDDSDDPGRKRDEPLLVAFPGKTSSNKFAISDTARGPHPNSKGKNKSKGQPPQDTSFFGKIAKMYERDPENLTSQKNAKASHPRATRWDPYDARRGSLDDDDHRNRCLDLCYCLAILLTLGLLGFVIYLIVKPDQAILMGDGMCSPIAPYQTLTTDKGKIGIAPWWVWPASSKSFMFDVMCGDDRIRTMLVWAPKHHHEKEFRLILGDVNQEETVLRLNGLEGARILPSEIEIRQSKKAQDEEELPDSFAAVWMKGWDEDDKVERKLKVEADGFRPADHHGKAGVYYK